MTFANITDPIDTSTPQHHALSAAYLFAQQGPALLLALVRLINSVPIEFDDPKLEKAMNEALELTGLLYDVLDLPDDYGDDEQETEA